MCIFSYRWEKALLFVVADLLRLHEEAGAGLAEKKRKKKKKGRGRGKGGGRHR